MAPAAAGTAEGHDDPLHRTARNLLLSFLVLAAAGLLLVHRVTDPRTAIIVIAAVVAVLACMTMLVKWTFGSGTATWVALAAGFLASRALLVLASGRIFAARDAPDHIYGLPVDLLRDGHLPLEVIYAAYPAIHLLLVETHFVTGLPLWEGAQALSLALGLVALFLVARTAETLWPGSGPYAGLGYLVAYFAIPPGELYTPLTLAVVWFAFMAFLLAKDRALAWSPALFIVGVTLLGLTHPYSAVIIGILVFLALAAHGFLGGGVRFLAPVAVAMALGIGYVAFVGHDLTYFLDLVTASKSATEVGTVSTATPALPGAPKPSYSFAYQQLTAWHFRLAMGAALVGWIWSLLSTPRLKWMSHLVLAAAGATFLVSLVIAYGFPNRTLVISSVAAAPFIGFALWKAPRWAAFPTIALLVGVSVLSPASTYQFFPLSDDDSTVHAYDDPPETAAFVPFFLSISDGDYRTSDTISSHAVFDGQRALSIRAFASTDTVARAPREHYIFRDEAIDYGFSVVTTQASYQRRADFVPFPTPPQLAFLERVDRIGDFGTLTLGRW